MYSNSRAKTKRLNDYSIVQVILMFGAATLLLNLHLKNRPFSTQMDFYRRFVGKSRVETIKNSRVFEIILVKQDFVKTVEYNKLRICSHTA